MRFSIPSIRSFAADRVDETIELFHWVRSMTGYSLSLAELQDFFRYRWEVQWNFAVWPRGEGNWYFRDAYGYICSWYRR